MDGWTVTQMIAVITFAGGLIYSFAKLYKVFVGLQEAIDELKDTIKNFNNKFDNHDQRLTRLEERTRTLFSDYDYIRKEMKKND